MSTKRKVKHTCSRCGSVHWTPAELPANWQSSVELPHRAKAGEFLYYETLCQPCCKGLGVEALHG